VEVLQPVLQDIILLLVEKQEMDVVFSKMKEQ
jgi:hypothetical protein